MSNPPDIVVFGSLNADWSQTVDRLPKLGRRWQGAILRPSPAAKAQIKLVRRAGWAAEWRWSAKWETIALDSSCWTAFSPRRRHRAGREIGQADRDCRDSRLAGRRKRHRDSAGANAAVTARLAESRLAGLKPRSLLLCQLETSLESVRTGPCPRKGERSEDHSGSGSGSPTPSGVATQR